MSLGASFGGGGEEILGEGGRVAQRSVGGATKPDTMVRALEKDVGNPGTQKGALGTEYG